MKNAFLFHRYLALVCYFNFTESLFYMHRHTFNVQSERCYFEVSQCSMLVSNHRITKKYRKEALIKVYISKASDYCV